MESFPAINTKSARRRRLVQKRRIRSADQIRDLESNDQDRVGFLKRWTLERNSLLCKSNGGYCSSTSDSDASVSLSSSSSSSDLEQISEGNPDVNLNLPIGILASGGEALERIPCRSHGSVSVCGRRREMEDAVSVVPGFARSGGTDLNLRYDFFAVYDGHGGSSVAHACRDRLHVLLAREVERSHRIDGEFKWPEVLEACFLTMDEEVRKEAEAAGDATAVSAAKTVGSTAVVALVGNETIVVANCGDSRAVLSREGVALPLSSDHKPDRPDEMERVEAAGGRVISWDGCRVLGVLATSRSIGDHYLKPYVISEPEVIVTERISGDEFLILASDGLWDAVSNELACNVVRRCLASRSMNGLTKRRAEEAAAMLAELAMGRGSKDNVSVVVIELTKSGDLFL